MKRKIAFHLNCLEQGGAERVVSNLANRFAKEGYEVLLATEWYGENEFQIDREVRRVHVGLREGDNRKPRPNGNHYRNLCAGRSHKRTIIRPLGKCNQNIRPFLFYKLP